MHSIQRTQGGCRVDLHLKIISPHCIRDKDSVDWKCTHVHMQVYYYSGM